MVDKEEKKKLRLSEQQKYRLAEFQFTVVDNQYIPFEPTPCQVAFLMRSEYLEAFFGGASRGGKSFSLLMAALQYVSQPEYAALLLRRTYTDLTLHKALMDLADNWLIDTDAVWHERTKTWVFPSGATLTFGYLENERDKYRYKSSDFSMIGFDELTGFTESKYTYMFSRLTRAEGSSLPLRMRSASNPGDMGHCVPYGRVLTINGWVDIADIKLGDCVYTVLESGTLSLRKVKQTYKELYQGDMVTILGRGLSIICTPNHKIAKVNGTEHKQNTVFSLVAFNHLPGQAILFRSVEWEGEAIKQFILPKWYMGRKLRNSQPKELPGVLYASLVGWMLSEGCTIERDKAISIAQSKEKNKKKINTLLQDCGFKFSYHTKQFVIYSPDWWHYFSQFGHSREKFIPTALKAANVKELKALFNALIDGDGHWDKLQQSGQYYTISKQLCDDVMEIAFKLGYIVSSHKRQRPNRVGLSYCVNFKMHKNKGTEVLTNHHIYNVQTKTKRKSNIKNRPYDGYVYCIGVEDTHNFIIEQNGCVWISGNSWVKTRFITPSKEELRKNNMFFQPAYLEDNPYIDQKAYIESLNRLDPISREQLRHGNWDIEITGNFFKRESFDIVPSPPPALQVRYWDMAASVPKKGTEPDWTVGALMSVSHGIYSIKSIIRFQKTPADSEKIIKQTAEIDGITTRVFMEQEPGASGLIAIDHYAREVLQGYAFTGIKSTGSKVVRAQPFSAAVENGNVKICKDCQWIEDMLYELVAFPTKGIHDDIVDALSGAFTELNQGKTGKAIPASAMSVPGSVIPDLGGSGDIPGL
ncbi:MAG: phage terminase large subunit [Candidatus Marinimicrobia bacterium]|nr:phage terminase large subunit [Candidatus Neomarinimicrobiota bacterium]